MDGSFHAGLQRQLCADPGAYHFRDFPDSVAYYFLVAGYFTHRLVLATEFTRKIFQRMTLLQMVTMELFLVLMLSLPVKILLRLLLRIKYVWVTPWFSVQRLQIAFE